MRSRYWLLVAWLLAGTGCRQVPQSQWNQLQGLRKELFQAEAHRYAAGKFQVFEVDFELIRKAYALEAGSHTFFPKTDLLEWWIGEAIRKGQVLLTDTRAAREHLRLSQRQRLNVIRANLAVWSAGTLHPRYRRRITEIELKTQQAQALWNQGDYLRVAEALVRVDALNSAFQSQVDDLQQRYNDPAVIRRWENWVHETRAWSRTQRTAVLVVDKYNRRALVYQDGQLSQEFAVDLGWNRLRDKVEQGDGATPEGQYRVLKKKGQGKTQYYLALLLDYPNATDRRQFSQGSGNGSIPRRARLGDLIEIHGEGGRGRDWTQGCVALNNPDMKRLYEIAYVGMPVTVVGEFKE